jgi:hypothetical protein
VCAPEEKFAWHPPRQSMTLGCLICSLVEIPTEVTAAIRRSSLDVTRVNVEESAAVAAAYSATRYLEAFDSNVIESRDDIAAASDEHLQQRLPFELDGKAVLSMPREAVIRHAVLGRLRWHRTLLTMYLQLARVPPGPSADATPGDSSAESFIYRPA